jgi:hypothetical protein
MDDGLDDGLVRRGLQPVLILQLRRQARLKQLRHRYIAARLASTALCEDQGDDRGMRSILRFYNSVD